MASGATLCKFTPKHNEPPSSSYATPDVRNGIHVLDFDAASIEAAIFRDLLPRIYGSSGVTVYLHWMATSATSGDVKWGASIERDNANNHDLDSDNFATEQTNTGTANGTSGKITVTTITISDGANMDSLAIGEAFRLKVRRVANDGADTMTGDAELLAIELKET